MNPSLYDQKAREEAKRDRIYDPLLRWKHIQEAITWAEANMPPHLRRNRPRVPKRQSAQAPLVQILDPGNNQPPLANVLKDGTS